METTSTLGECVRACVRDVFAIYDNNISPSLLMIQIKIMILYFIQIRHTDDFPPTGTPASSSKDKTTSKGYGLVYDKKTKQHTFLGAFNQSVGITRWPFDGDG